MPTELDAREGFDGRQKIRWVEGGPVDPRDAEIARLRAQVAALQAQQPGAQAVYSIDTDEAGIRARVSDAITGALMFGTQGVNAPPADHWLTPFWEMARAEAESKSLGNASTKASEDYDLIDRFLGNNLSGSDYEKYSAALDRVYTHPQPPSIPEPSEQDVDAVMDVLILTHGFRFSDDAEGEVRAALLDGFTIYTARLRERIGGGV